MIKKTLCLVYCTLLGTFVFNFFTRPNPESGFVSFGSFAFVSFWLIGPLQICMGVFRCMEHLTQTCSVLDLFYCLRSSRLRGTLQVRLCTAPINKNNNNNNNVLHGLTLLYLHLFPSFTKLHLFPNLLLPVSWRRSLDIIVLMSFFRCYCSSMVGFVAVYLPVLAKLFAPIYL